jgi:ornithine cyclodeaminase
MIPVYHLSEIKKICADLDFSAAIEAGFVAYSKGQVVVPPVGELSFTLPPGDTHIKYGYIIDNDQFVVKIASGFYDNPQLGLPSNSGLMLVFSQKTGQLETILLDDGYLTDVRTAVAGQIVAKYLAPSEVSRIGILGSGIQARMQVMYLQEITPCKELVVWGRNADSLARYKDDMSKLGFFVETTSDVQSVAEACNLIITATPSQEPLLRADQVQPGTHITAMGADTPAKQELDSALFQKADLVVADSIVQCQERGDISRALRAGLLEPERIVELGTIICGERWGRTSDEQLSIADLTGVAIQDIQIAKAVCRAMEQS